MIIKRLRNKITLAIVIIVVFLSLGVIIAVINIISPALRDNLKRDGAKSARNISVRSVNPVLTGNILELKDLISDEKTINKDVVYVFVLDSKGNILAHTCEEGFPVELKDANSSNSGKSVIEKLLDTDKGFIYDFAMPVLAGDGKIATVRIGLTEINIQKTINNTVGVITAIITGILILSIFIGIKLSSMIVKPVRILQNAAEKMSRGELNTKIDIKTGDEIQSLAETFNMMSAELRKTTGSLENTLNLLTDANVKLLTLLTDVEKTGNVKTRFENPNLVKCWEIKNCTKKECPSHGSKDLRCWQVAGTHCQGTVQGEFAKKLKNCEQCEVYKHAIPDKITETGEIFNNMMLILENKSRDLEKAKERIEEYNKTLELKVEERTKQLEVVQTKLVKSEKMAAVGQLAGGVAHEINNPLTIILGYAQTLMRNIKEGDPIYKPLKSMENAAVRCKKIVNDLLAFSRAEKLENENVDINEAIDQAVTLVQAWSKVKEIQVVKNYGQVPLISTNKNQIQQVIVNLCNNAVDAMPDGGTITITTKQLENFFIEITVADTGKGMSEEAKHHIFEPFFTTKDVGKGTGLGLSLCHGIIVKNGGSIEISSETGKGTTVRIKLPVAQQDIVKKP